MKKITDLLAVFHTASSPQMILGVGIVAGLVSTLIWGSWVAITRLGVTTNLTPSDIALIRYGVPSLFLFPIVIKKISILKKIGFLPLFFMVIGAGLPYSLLASNAMQFVPSGNASAVLHGASPVIVALVSYFLFKEKYTLIKVAGLAVIILGILLINSYSFVHDSPSTLFGYFLLLLGSTAWSCFTIAVKRSNAGGWFLTGFISLASTLLFLPYYLVFAEKRIFEVPFTETALQILSQGILVGLVAMFTYSLAIKNLGPSIAAVFVALTPVLAAIFGMILVGDRPSLTIMIGIFCVFFGVSLASGVFAKLMRKKPRGEVQKSQV